MINIFEEAFKANAALNAKELNEHVISSTSVAKKLNEGYEGAFRKLLTDSDNLQTGAFGEKDTKVSDSGFKLFSQVSSLDVDFNPETKEYLVILKDEDGTSIKRKGTGFNELISELESITNDMYSTWFYDLPNPWDYYKLDESNLEEDIYNTGRSEKTVALGTLYKGDKFSKYGYKYEIVRVDGGNEDITVKPIGRQNPEDDVNTMGYVLMRGSDSVTKIEEGLFGKKKSKSTKSTGNKDVERTVEISIYDENGTEQFSHTFKEIPGKMKAEEQLNQIIKSNGVLARYKASDKKYDWSYERKSNPESPFDTDKYFNAASKIIRESIEELVALNKIKFTESIDSFQPEDELMVVYNADLDDEMTEEEIQAEAESLIGCDICKCGVCGANYVCKENETPDVQDIVVIDEEDVEDGTIEEVKETEENFEIEESLLFRHLNEAEGEEEVKEETTEEVVEEPTEEIKTPVEEVSAEEATEEECCNRVCPICGATENQVLTATIAPIEEPAEEVETTTDEEAAETEVTEPEDAATNEEIVEEIPGVAEETITESIGSEGIFVTGNELVAVEPIFYADVENLFFEAEDVEKFEKLGYIADGKFTFPRGTKFIVGKEAPSNNGVMLKVVKIDEEFEFVYEDENDERFLVVDTVTEIKEEVEVEKEIDSLAEDTLDLDESTLNRLFTKFARENYENVVNVRINEGKLVNGQLCLEGYVRAKSGVKRPIKLVSEGLELSNRTTKIKIVEKGPFTESAELKPNRVPFVLECVVDSGTIKFTGLKYNYIVKESKQRFSVSGKVTISE